MTPWDTPLNRNTERNVCHRTFRCHRSMRPVLCRQSEQCDPVRQRLGSYCRKFHPPVLPRTPQLAVRRYRGRRSGQRPAVLVRARRRTDSSPTPTCAACSPSCPGRSRSATSKRCCRPGSPPQTCPELHSEGSFSSLGNDAVHGALTVLRAGAGRQGRREALSDPRERHGSSPADRLIPGTGPSPLRNALWVTSRREAPQDLPKACLEPAWQAPRRR